MKQRVESRGHRMSRQMVANLRDTEEGCAKEAHRKPSLLVTEMGCAMEAHRKPSVRFVRLFNRRDDTKRTNSVALAREEQKKERGTRAADGGSGNGMRHGGADDRGSLRAPWKEDTYAA